MLAYYVKRSLGEEFEKVSSRPQEKVWVVGSDLHDQEIDQLIEQNGLDKSIVYDLRDRHELPRVEFAGEDAYIFLRLPVLARSGHVRTHPLLIVARPEQFFTLSMHETISTDMILKMAHIGDHGFAVKLLIGALVTCIAQYDELLKHTERSIDDTGNRLRTHEITNRDFIHFVTVEENLTGYRMNLDGILAVIRRLKDTSHLPITDKLREELDDIILQLQQLLVAVDNYTGRVNSIRNAHTTIANNNLNNRIKILTVLTVLITLPNLFYGMYGMNVALPFENEPWAYGVVVGFTVLLVVLVVGIAKRLRIF